MYRVTAIGRGQPQAPTHRQLVPDYKYQRSNPMSEYFAQRTPKSHQQNRLKEKHGKALHVNGKVDDVFTCETNMSLRSSQLRTQIEITSTTGKVLYNALLDTGDIHNLLSFNAWNQLERPTLTQSDFQVKGVNGQTSYVLVFCQQLFIVTNGHMQGSFLCDAYRRTL